MNYECICCKYNTLNKSNYNKHLETVKHLNTKILYVQRNNELVKKTSYSCEICNYTSFNRYDYNKHLKTVKHLSKVSNVELYMHTCEICDKRYKYNKSYLSHIEKCGNLVEHTDENLDEDTQQIVKDQQQQQIINLQDLLEKAIKGLHHQTDNINTLVPMIGTGITNNTNNINNKMTINLFLNQECKNAMNLNEFIDGVKMSLADLQYTGLNGYSKGITNIFVKNLSELEPTERPIHCSDKKRLQFYVKDEDKWEKDVENNKLDSTIRSITQKQIIKLQDWVKLHPNWEDSDEETKTYMTMISRMMGGKSDEETNKNYNNIKKELGVNLDMSKVLHS
jgi:hypothetical protein